MGDRNMERKMMKLKRQRRLFPKQYSSDYIPVPRGKPGPDMAAACGLVSRYQKPGATGLANSEEFLNHLDKRFGNVPPGKKEAYDRMVELRNLMPEPYCRVVLDNGKFKVKLFYTLEKDKFFLKEFNKHTYTERTSIVYDDEGYCLSRWKLNRTVWVKS